MVETVQNPGTQFYVSIKIKDFLLRQSGVINLIIKEWIFNSLVSFELVYADDGYFSEIFPLEDQEDIEIILAKNELDENPISLIFSLDDYMIDTIGDNRKIMINIIGHLKVNSEMFQIKNRSFSRRNSVSVFQQIANESGLSFYNPYNIISNDNMTWFQAQQNNFDFIRHVLNRCYIPDDCLFFYSRNDSKYVLTSLKNEMNKKNVKMSKFSIENFQNDKLDEDDVDNTIWFSNYNIVNNSSFFNKKLCYGFEYSYFDLRNFQKNNYSNISSISRNSLTFRNRNFISPVYNNTFGEVSFSNIYNEKYFESLIRNEFLKNNFFANSLILNINSLSQVNLMDTIDLYIPSLFKDGEINNILSGYYLVSGIQHQISTGGVYTKKLALCRNSMNKTEYVNFYKVEEL